MSELYLIGEGRRNKIYRNGNTAIKMFVDSPQYKVEREAELQRFAYEAGLPVPKIYGIRRIDSRTVALNMEYIDGEIIANESMNIEEMIHTINVLIELQKKVHAVNVKELSNMHEQLRMKLERSKYIDDRYRKKMYEIVEKAKTEELALCHGDFHPLNILFDGSKYWIIDWAEATVGNRLVDICRSYLIQKSSGFEAVADYYVNTYCKGECLDINEVLVFIPVLAAIRLEENVTATERKRLEEIISAYLEENM